MYKKYIPSVNPHQINTAESSPTEARYLSPGDHPTSVTSCATSKQSMSGASARARTAFMSHQSLQGLPALDIDLVRTPHLPPRRPAEHTPQSAAARHCTSHTRSTHGSRSHIITISSSLPLASHRPECAQRTTSTGPVCIVSVLSDFGGRPESSEAWLRIGFVLQMRTFASRPPVAMREPSGWTWQEKMETRFSSPRMAESACAES